MSLRQKRVLKKANTEEMTNEFMNKLGKQINSEKQAEE